MATSEPQTMENKNSFSSLFSWIDGNIDCSVKFLNNPSMIYHDGETLNGVLEVTLDKPMRLNRLSSYIEGFAYFCITKGEDSFSDKEIYFTSALSMDGSARTLQPGKNQINFSYTLPRRIPSSYGTRDGHIKYLISFIFERSGKFDLFYQKKITVIRTTDLNIEKPELKKPLVKEIKHKFEYLLKLSNPLIMKVSLPMSGFVAAQEVPIKIFINNPTDTTVKYIKIELIAFFNYKYNNCCLGTGEACRCETVKKEKILESVVNGNKEYYKNFKFPYLIPSTLGSCKIIDISFQFKVTAKVSVLHQNPTMNIPITIGTVPFHNLESEP